VISMVTDEEELTFWEHFEELINRLRIGFFAVIVATLFVMAFPIGFGPDGLSLSNPTYVTVASLLINRIQQDFLPVGVELMPISWYAPLEVYLYVSLILGVTLSLPVSIYELYKFISPALYKSERKSITPFAISFTALFAFGFALGYFLVMPATVRLLLLSAEASGLSPRYEFSQFFSLVAGGLFVCGFVMTFPVYLALSVRAGALETTQLKKNRRYMYGAVLVGIALIDPDPTLITELFLGVPVILVFEAAIRLASRYESRG